MKLLAEKCLGTNNTCKWSLVQNSVLAVRPGCHRLYGFITFDIGNCTEFADTIVRNRYSISQR